MEVTFDLLKIEQYEINKQLPATLIKREAGALWLTREAPVDSDKTNAVYTTNSGDYVRVPLFPYITINNEPALAIAFATSLAIKATRDIPYNHEIVKLHISMGNPVQEVNNIPDTTGSVLRFWIGIAFQIKEG